jgi:DNA repair protein RadC
MKTYKTTIENYSIVKNKTDFPKVKITTSLDAADFMRKFYSGDIEIYESFFILLLNRQNITEGYVKISQGGTAGTVTDIKLICRYAIEALAQTVIVCHNHPSGNIQPSDQDIQITKKIKEALNICDIQLIDHLILTAENYYSLTDNGQL